MEKRVLLAVILSFVVLYGYQAWVPPPKPVETPVTRAPAPPTPSASASQPASTPATPGGPVAGQPVAPEPQSTPVVADSAERDVTFESESVHAVFTTRGGALKSWRLKKYQDATRQPLELVPHTVPPGTLRPFTLSVPDPKLSATLAQALFKPSAEALQASSGPVSLTFEYQDASGLTARKEFLFAPASPYVVDFSATVAIAGKELVPTIEWGPGICNGLA